VREERLIGPAGRRLPGGYRSAMARPTAASPAAGQPIESVDHALTVLLLVGERGEVRLSDVVDRLGVEAATASRVLGTLQHRGFLRQDQRTGAYRAGTALAGMASAVLHRFDVRDTLRPCLGRLHSELAETVHLAQLDGATVRFIDAIESPQPMRASSKVGQSLPAHCTSSGKSMLALLPVEEIRRLYPDERLPTLTPNSLRGRAELEEELSRVARRGYATSNEESEPGVCSVAVALPAGPSPMRLALNVSVLTSRITRVRMRMIAEAVRSAVATASTLVRVSP
jgi:DNA-binding IclR family transcriptional regulator